MAKRKNIYRREKKEVTYNKKIKTEFCESTYINDVVIKEEINADEDSCFHMEEVLSSSCENHVIEDENTFVENGDCFPGFSIEETMAKRKNIYRREKKEVIYNKKIKTEFCESTYINDVVIKEEINVDEDSCFHMEEVLSSSCENHVIKDENTFVENGDCFPGFSVEECKSAKVKAVIMEKLLFNKRGEENSAEECIKTGSKNITNVNKENEGVYQKVILRSSDIDTLNNSDKSDGTNISKNKVSLDKSILTLLSGLSVVEEKLVRAEPYSEQQSMEKDNFSDTGTLINEDIEGSICYLTSGSKEHKFGLSKARPVSTDKYKCCICNKSFSHRNSLSHHKFVHSGVKKHKCDVCNKLFIDKSGLLRHMLIHSGVKKYKCDICNKAFCQQSNFSRHKLIHSGEMKHQCDVCKKTFLYKNHLSRHKMIHSSVRKYQCDICNKGFYQKSNMARHVLIHNGINIQHQCDICNKVFRKKASLISHGLTHTGVKKHKCDVCDKSFVYEQYLPTHKLIHTGVKEHQCSVCDKAFTQQGTLRKHELIHSNVKQYQCDFCNKAFTQKCTLVTHISTHSSVKTHQCDICNKTFKQRAYFEKHKLLVHSGSKKYKCNVCDKAFTYKSTLIKHILIHNKIVP